MRSYRAFLLSKSDQITAPAFEFESADDPAAIAYAQQRIDGHDIEIWEGQRRVGRVSRSA
jgi:hypothetical protein